MRVETVSETSPSRLFRSDRESHDIDLGDKYTSRIPDKTITQATQNLRQNCCVTENQAAINTDIAASRGSWDKIKLKLKLSYSSEEAEYAVFSTPNSEGKNCGVTEEIASSSQKEIIQSRDKMLNFKRIFCLNNQVSIQD